MVVGGFAIGEAENTEIVFVASTVSASDSNLAGSVIPSTDL